MRSFVLAGEKTASSFVVAVFKTVCSFGCSFGCPLNLKGHLCELKNCMHCAKNCAQFRKNCALFLKLRAVSVKLRAVSVHAGCPFRLSIVFLYNGPLP